MNMIKRLSLLLMMLAGVTAYAYTSLEELTKDINIKQIEAIRAYIADNPEAPDMAEARERLIYSLISIDDYQGALDLLTAQYKELPADKSGVDLSTAFGEIVVPIIQLYKMEGRKDDGVAFIAEVRESFKQHEMFETIDEALNEFGKMFDLPGPGDTIDISFTAIDGREVNLADLKGKVVLVDFWATWCVPCLKAMPEIKSLYAEFHDKGLEIIGISLDDDKEKLQNYLTKEGIAWPQFFDGNGWENKFAQEYGIESIPATFLIGPDGLIAATDLSGAALKARIAELLASIGDSTDGGQNQVE
jgi:thiol-disulfide isomerase/thioredoxin